MIFNKKAEVDEVLMVLFLLGLDINSYRPWLDEIKETGNINATVKRIPIIDKLCVDEKMKVDKKMKCVIALFEEGADISKTAFTDGSTVAHFMARRGYKFTDYPILKLSDFNGNTVAYDMAKKENPSWPADDLKLRAEEIIDIAQKIASAKFIAACERIAAKFEKHAASQALNS